MPSLKDLTGKRFGRLVVISRDFDYPKQHNIVSKAPYWKCQCDCGNIISTRGDALNNGKTISCGCFRKEQAREATMKHLAGQTFGKITVLEDLNESNNQHRILHKCRCECCGTIFKVCTTDLTANRIESCGCVKSKGEQKLIDIFHKNNISYIKEYSFNDLISKAGVPLRFDFYLPDLNVLVEYQGFQHFNQSSNYFSQSLLDNDNMKKEYCSKHKIKLIEITYKDFNNLTYDFIKSLI